MFAEGGLGIGSGVKQARQGKVRYQMRTQRLAGDESIYIGLRMGSDELLYSED